VVDDTDGIDLAGTSRWPAARAGFIRHELDPMRSLPTAAATTTHTRLAGGSALDVAGACSGVLRKEDAMLASGRSDWSDGSQLLPIVKTADDAHFLKPAIRGKG